MNLPSALMVERRSGLTTNQFRKEYERPLRPVVMPDATRDWAAHGKWNTAWLRDNFGERLVTSEGIEHRLADLLDKVEASTASAPGPYLRECYLQQYLPELRVDLTSWPGIGAGRLQARGLPRRNEFRDGSPELLVAGAGTHFPVLHYDLHHLHAFVTQVTGEKRFWLYPPSMKESMYPRDDMRNLSRIDRFAPVDSARFPRFAEAQAIEAVIGPGDTIFVPGGWWHRTQILSTSVALAFSGVGRGNWTTFTDDFMMIDYTTRPFRSALKKSYMALLGGWLNLREGVGFAH